MNRTLKRPMFRIGGSAGTGITSGLDQPRKQYSQGTDPYDRALKTTERFREDMDKFRGEQGQFAPSGLPGFLTSFGLNLLSATPRGNIFATAATAAKEPFQTFQAANLARQDDDRKSLEDMFGTALASEYDLEGKRIEADAETPGDTRKTPEVERGIIIGAQNAIFRARDILNDPNADADSKQDAERTIKVNQNVLVKELGVPAEYAAIISSPELFEGEMDAFVDNYNESQKQKQLEFLQNNPDKTEVDALNQFPTIQSGSAKARQLTIENLRERFYYAKGGRAGYKFGSPEPMMESVVEQEKQTGEVQDLSYTELRNRLPQEVSNEIVMLLANSKQALLDFANIQTTEDISNFNKQYDVNLTLPQGA